MKKILVFICLMVLSSSVFSLGTSVEMYKNWKEDARENGHIEFFLRGVVQGIYEGLTAFEIQET
ncbi:MAG: hypothetical protein QF734_07990 [Arenicellales bacterium]|nr:hypothetical protein [Arenicellales bacterium]